jgi:hypothetical protein
MRLITGLLLGLFAGGCTESRKLEVVTEVPQDTVYDGNIIDREKLESIRPTIKLDNGNGDRPSFVVGDTSLLRIRIPIFTEYDIHINEITGATVILVDTARNKFLVVPEDTQFSFVLNQHYPKGQVIRYTRNWNAVKAVYDEQMVRLEGLVRIAKIDFIAQ